MVGGGSFSGCESERGIPFCSSVSPFLPSFLSCFGRGAEAPPATTTKPTPMLLYTHTFRMRDIPLLEKRRTTLSPPLGVIYRPGVPGLYIEYLAYMSVGIHGSSALYGQVIYLYNAQGFQVWVVTSYAKEVTNYVQVKYRSTDHWAYSKV